MSDIDQHIYPDIPGYDIHAELGVGGIATVYLAVQKSLDRRVALKVMSPILAVEPDYAERFVREGRTIAKLSHTNIITVYDIGVQKHKLYIAMEHIPEGNLRSQLETRKGDADWALSVAGQMALALGYAHRHNVIHRDVKPENILFRENGVAVLTDFGIAKTISSDTNLTRAGAVIGTPKYMSPEQTDGLGNDPQTDIYSLGIILFEMLTGRVPYESENSMAVLYAHVHSPIPKLPQGLHDLQPLIDQMLAKNPKDRPADCDKLAEIIRLMRRERHIAMKNAAPGEVGEFLKDTLEIEPQMQEPDSAAGRDTMQASWISRAADWLRGRPAWQYLGIAAVVVLGAMVWPDNRVAQEKATVILPRAAETDSPPAPAAPAGISSAQPVRAETERERVILSEFLSDDTVTGPATTATGSKAAMQHPRQAEIDALLGKARTAVEDGQLHYPKEGSAIHWYQAVMQIDPGNIRAQRGLQAVADLLKEKAIAQNNKGNPDLALVLIAAALDATPGDVALKTLQSDINGSFKAASSYKKAEQLYYGKGVKQNLRRAAFYYRKAADRGHREAMNALGVMYVDGTGVKRNESMAKTWFRKAADKNDAEAMYNLALGYLFGKQKKTASALPLATAASSLEYRPAYRLVGWMYTTGTGVAANTFQAFRWDLKGMVNPINNKLESLYRTPKTWQDRFDIAYKEATDTAYAADEDNS